MNISVAECYMHINIFVVAECYMHRHAIKIPRDAPGTRFNSSQILASTERNVNLLMSWLIEQI